MARIARRHHGAFWNAAPFPLKSGAVRVAAYRRCFIDGRISRVTEAIIVTGALRAAYPERAEALLADLERRLPPDEPPAGERGKDWVAGYYEKDPRPFVKGFLRAWLDLDANPRDRGFHAARGDFSDAIAYLRENAAPPLFGERCPEVLGGRPCIRDRGHAGAHRFLASEAPR